MSFILDALKKSENDRQQQASAEFATLPSAAATPATPRWIWAVIVLLVVNVAVLAAFMISKDDSTPVAAATAEPATLAVAPDAAASGSFAERISKASVPERPAQQAAPAPAVRDAAAREQDSPPAPSRTAAATPAARTAPAPLAETSAQALPTLTEIRLNDNVNLPDLHLDIHVYAGSPADRFVFINMSKHQEGSVLQSGPRVEEITPDGVILDYRGTRFVLPRE